MPTVDGQNGSTEEYQADAQAPPTTSPQASSIGQIDWKEYAENYSNDLHGGLGRAAGGGRRRRAPRRRSRTSSSSARSLPDHLIWQLRLSDLSDAEKELGALIIGNLDKDGYLPLQLEEIAFLADTSGRDIEDRRARARAASRSSTRRASPRATCRSAC